jgi:hypothetical protein
VVQGGISAEHHPSEVGPLKRQRESHRTSIVTVANQDGDDVRRTQIVIPIESVDSSPIRTLRSIKRWFKPVGRWPATELAAVPGDASLVLDRFQFTLFVGAGDDGFEVTATHDGDPFYDLAVGFTVDVYFTAEFDVRRAKPPDFEEAASSGRIVGAQVGAYGVHSL